MTLVGERDRRVRLFVLSFFQFFFSVCLFPTEVFYIAPWSFLRRVVLLSVSQRCFKKKNFHRQHFARVSPGWPKMYFSPDLFRENRQRRDFPLAVVVVVVLYAAVLMTSRRQKKHFRAQKAMPGRFPRVFNHFY